MRHHYNKQSVSVAAAVLLGLACGVASAAKPTTTDPAALDKAFETLNTYDWGTDRALLNSIDDAIVAEHGDVAACKALELRLIAVLKTDASRDAKDYVCRKLMVIGTDESIRTLAGLLDDKDLSHMARYALERIPTLGARHALCGSLPSLPSDLTAGVIASLGARRDFAHVPMLARLLTDADQSVAGAAARALGIIGNVKAAEALDHFSATAPTDKQPWIADARLACAEQLLRDGNGAEAEAIYKSLQIAAQPGHVLVAATRGLLVVVSQGDKPADVEAGVKMVAMVVGLLSNEDNELRALGLQQIREGAKGRAATKEFAGQLPKLAPEAQADLVDALADRGDRVALPAIRAMLKGPVAVQAAAIRGLGTLGDAAEVESLVQLLAAAAEPNRTAIRGGLLRLQGTDVHKAIAAELTQRESALRIELIDVLAARRAFDSVPSILAAAVSDDVQVRMAAMAALGQLAGPEHLAAMVQGVLKADKGTERDAAEKAVMFVCNRIPAAGHRLDGLLAILAQVKEDDRIALLPTLGRVGGPAALPNVEAAIANQDSRQHEAGMQALCHWPDASIATRLLELAQTAGDANDRTMALGALIRVAPLPDKRPAAEKLWLMKKAMTLTTRDSERNLVLQRARAIRTIESLRFVTAYLDQPAYAQQACDTVVELARHRELREANKAEFDKALDTVIHASKDVKVIDRAKRYQKGQT